MHFRQFFLLISIALVGLSCGRFAAEPEMSASEPDAHSSESPGYALYGAARNGDEAAFAQLRTLAEQGDAVAQNLLGTAYLVIIEFQDLSEAERWYRTAALQGLPVAQGNLGSWYATARGEEKDLSAARLWLTLSAEQGHWLAQAGLGDLYRGAHGSDPDLAQAYKWYTIAVKVVSEMGRDDLEEGMLERRARLAEQMTPDQISKGEELAAGWTRRDWVELESQL